MEISGAQARCLATAVRSLRALRKLSVGQLADMAGMPVAAVAELEAGRGKGSVAGVRAVARALRCHPSVLVLRIWLRPASALWTG
jgi:transcriptional regulator with XRE-family HTH domain